eukprot:318532-Amorphochlora_amoeboformis.AAC.1
MAITQNNANQLANKRHHRNHHNRQNMLEKGKSSNTQGFKQEKATMTVEATNKHQVKKIDKSDLKHHLKHHQKHHVKLNNSHNKHPMHTRKSKKHHAHNNRRKRKGLTQALKPAGGPVDFPAVSSSKFKPEEALELSATVKEILGVIPGITSQMVYLAPAPQLIRAIFENNPKLLPPLLNYSSMVVCAFVS